MQAPDPPRPRQRESLRASVRAGRQWPVDPHRRLALAIGMSVLLHLMLLSLRFATPAVPASRPIDPGFEVVLLSARTDARPLAPQVSAQVDLLGGGDRRQGQARSPLPAQDRREEGRAPTRQRTTGPERQQSRLPALSGGNPPAPEQQERSPSEALQSLPQDDDLDTDAMIARMQSQIDRQLSDYNNRPKRLTYGINAVGVSYARYVTDWAARIERIGSERYPTEARGKMYDSLIITVEIDRDGKVVNVLIDRPSKYPALNRAARRIVQAGAPYPPFSAEMAREGDILQITRTWTFTRDALATAALDAEGSPR
jgi:protein TonB